MVFEREGHITLYIAKLKIRKGHLEFLVMI